MKTKNIYIPLLSLIAVVVGGAAMADSGMATVNVSGNPKLTIPSNTSQACINDLKKSGWSGQDTTVSGQLKFSPACTNISLTLQGGSGNKNTQAELNLQPGKTTYDISLVNGYNKPVTISGGGQTVSATSKNDAGNGVYGDGCSLCTSRAPQDYNYSTAGAYAGCSKQATCQITNDASKSYNVIF